MRKSMILGVGPALLGVVAASARADMVENAAFAFGALGFDLRGFHNPISDGIEVSGVNRFFSDTLDAGAWALTLNGPMSFQVSTGGRVLSQTDVSFGTNLSRDGTATPLTYTVMFDAGAQRRSVQGSVLVDGDFSHLGLGFYDISLRVSSQQSVTDDGIINAGTEQLDFDYGPIDIRGNVFADVLAVVTDPFFQATGQTNIFESLSGRGKLLAVLGDQSDAALSALQDLPTRIENRIYDAFGVDPGRIETLTMNTAGLKQRFSGGVVPEPTVLILMLLGIPAILRRRPRSREAEPVQGTRSLRVT